MTRSVQLYNIDITRELLAIVLGSDILNMREILMDLWYWQFNTCFEIADIL
jgi:hypothetical protein